MTPDELAAGLRAAGFAGVEQAGDLVFARVSGSASPEFQAECDAGHWVLTLARPVRAPTAALADWAARHSGAEAGVDQGEVRLRLVLPAGDAQGLIRWGALAEGFVQQCLIWRRAQRERGEGM